MQEGQFTHVEMYIGRRREAETLATRNEYSRLFSGRKLGKSALLRYVEELYDEKKLPSGNILHVVYVPIAGAEASEVVAKIIERVRTKLHFHFRPESETDPGKLLERFISDLLEEREKDSLLIVLDEADAFVESEIAEYGAHFESGVSWRMRTALGVSDNKDLPRVRFLVSGYRATNTRLGAWFNWHEILLLDPLSPQDAIALIECPLARIGIDACRQSANIAFRCGYQPAILLRFGERLLENLEQRRGSEREHIIVTSDDVAITFNDSAVQEEIRTVVRRNFQGNKIADLIFSALALDFSTLPPGSEIDNAPERVLARLKNIDKDLSWLHQDDSTSLITIARQLDQLVERKLLVKRVDRGVSRYHLRFPHHLSVILEPDQELAMKRQIAELKTGVGTDPHGGLRSVISSSMLTDISTALDPASGLPLSSVVVCSHWPEAVNHPTVGLGGRLEIESVDTAWEPKGLSKMTSPRTLLTGVHASAAPQALGTRLPGSAPILLVGGTDLARWALSPRPTGKDSSLVFPFARLSKTSLRWWLERVRCIEFDRPLAFEQLWLKTSGIPLLVRHADRILLERNPDGGFNVSERELQAVLDKFDKELPQTVAQLVTGPPDVALTAREIEILQMMVVACESTDFKNSSIVDDLMMDWELFCENCPLPALTESDELSVMVLEHVGLLPVAPGKSVTSPFDAMAPLSKGDALIQIVRALQTLS